MLTRNCLNCGKQKEDFTASHCIECAVTDARITEESRVQGLDYWQTQRAKQAAAGSLRKEFGMAGKSDPRMWREPIDMSAVRARLGK